MLDIDKGTENLKKADNFLSTFGAILKKHWGKILLLLFCWFIYFAITDETSIEEEKIEVVEESTESIEEEAVEVIEEVKPVVVEPEPVEQKPSNQDKLKIVDSYLELGKYGDTLIIFVWSDGKETFEKY